MSNIVEFDISLHWDEELEPHFRRALRELAEEEYFHLLEDALDMCDLKDGIFFRESSRLGLYDFLEVLLEYVGTVPLKPNGEPYVLYASGMEYDRAIGHVARMPQIGIELVPEAQSLLELNFVLKHA